jgi:hypothetical protein
MDRSYVTPKSPQPLIFIKITRAIVLIKIYPYLCTVKQKTWCHSSVGRATD